MPNPEEKWSPSDLTRTSYEIEGPQLDAAPLRVKLLVGQRVVADVTLREPGLLAIVSRPDKQGIAVEIVEPGPARQTDHGPTAPITAWQAAAILGE